LRVEAVNAPLSEVLSQLSTINLRYQGAALPERIVTGTYSGSLSQVLARLLDGSSYVTYPKGNGIILTIVRSERGRAPAGIPATIAAERACAWGAPSQLNPGIGIVIASLQ
jgi:hypothetical protein